MRTAKSARAFAALGASLAALVVPSLGLAEIDRGSVKEIDSGSVR